MVSGEFSPDGLTLATVSYDHAIVLWDIADRNRPTRLGSPVTDYNDPVHSVVFSPDKLTLATGSGEEGQTVTLWDITNRTRPTRLGTPLTGFAGPIAFSADGHIVATASTSNSGPMITLWDLTDRTRPTRLGLPFIGYTDSMDSAVTSIVFSPDEHTLAIGGADGNNGNLTLWDIADRTSPTRLGPTLIGIDHSPVASATNLMAFSRDGHTLATAGLDRDTDSSEEVSLWDLTDRARPVRLGSPLTGYAPTVDLMAFSPDGHTLVTIGDTAILWDLTEPTHPTSLSLDIEDNAHPLSPMALSSDGHTLAAARDDNTAILWDLTDRTRPGRVNIQVPVPALVGA